MCVILFSLLFFDIDLNVDNAYMLLKINMLDAIIESFDVLRNKSILMLLIQKSKYTASNLSGTMFLKNIFSIESLIKGYTDTNRLDIRKLTELY